MDKSAMDKMNSTYHFNYDSKMSIQAGSEKKYEKSMFTQAPDAPQFHNQRPFDKKAPGQLSLKDKLQALNRTIPQEKSADMLMVDVSTPPVPNAMERIRQKAKEKKEQGVKKRKQMEQQLEKAKDEVLASYNI